MNNTPIKKLTPEELDKSCTIALHGEFHNAAVELVRIKNHASALEAENGELKTKQKFVGNLENKIRMMVKVSKSDGLCFYLDKELSRIGELESLLLSYDRQDELIGTEFEGVDEVTEVISLLKQERDQLKAENEELKKQHDTLVERSVVAMDIADGEDYPESMATECPMLTSVVALRKERDQLRVQVGEIERSKTIAGNWVYGKVHLTPTTPNQTVLEWIEPVIGLLGSMIELPVSALASEWCVNELKRLTTIKEQLEKGAK